MNTLERQSQRLLQIGIGLVLFASFEGFVIPYFSAPPTGIVSFVLILWGLRMPDVGGRTV